MPLSPAQLAVLKADILAQGDLSPHVAQGPDGRFAIAAKYNMASADAFKVWSANVSVDAIMDELTYANFTPNDTPAPATELAAQQWENRAMLVQVKQINLQLLLQGRSTFNATKVKLRTGLQDATENLPTGNNGNVRTGGWAAIQPILSRTATRGEKLFSTGTGTTAVPATLDATLGSSLSVSVQDVDSALNLA